MNPDLLIALARLRRLDTIMARYIRQRRIARVLAWLQGAKC